MQLSAIEYENFCFVNFGCVNKVLSWQNVATLIGLANKIWLTDK